MDSAKSIAVMAANPGTYWDYIQGGSGKGLPIPCKPLPIVCITTTAGTGTEADPWTVITKEDTQEKIGFGFRGYFPHHVYRRSGVDAFRTSQINGISGV